MTLNLRWELIIRPDNSWVYQQQLHVQFLTPERRVLAPVCFTTPGPEWALEKSFCFIETEDLLLFTMGEWTLRDQRGLFHCYRGEGWWLKYYGISMLWNNPQIQNYSTTRSLHWQSLSWHSNTYYLNMFLFNKEDHRPELCPSNNRIELTIGKIYINAFVFCVFIPQV